MNENNAAQPVLTEEEIQDIADGFDIYGAKPEFARALETALLSKLRAPVADERAAYTDPLSDFQEGQWWVKELDELARAPGATHDQKRAVAVVHHMLRSAALASVPVATPGNTLTGDGSGVALPVAGEAPGTNRQGLLEAIHRYGNARAMAEHNIAYRDEVRKTAGALVALFDAAPQASAAPVAFSKDGVLFWYGDHAARRGFNGDLYLAPQASEAVRWVVTDDMRAAVRFAPSSAHWSERLKEFFGPDAREGINALEKQLREARADLDCQQRASEAVRVQALAALESAQRFIRNGVEFGYVRMPDADTPDPAHQTPGLIDAAIRALSAQPGAQRTGGSDAG